MTENERRLVEAVTNGLEVCAYQVLSKAWGWDQSWAAIGAACNWMNKEQKDYMREITVGFLKDLLTDRDLYEVHRPNNIRSFRREYLF